MRSDVKKECRRDKLRYILILALVLVLSTVNTYGKDLSEKQSHSNKQQEQLKEYIDFMESVKQEPNVLSNSFAGAYFDKNDNLIILVAIEDESRLSDVKKMFKNENIKVKKVMHSKSKLEKVVDEINSQAEYLFSKSIIITDIFVDIANNVVVINILDNNSSKEAIVRGIAKSDSITFGNSKNVRTTQSYAVEPGNEASWASVGFCATHPSYGDGFVMAGHSVDYVGEEIYVKGSDGIIFNGGMVKLKAHSTSIDAAFVKINSNVNISDNFQNRDILFGSETDYPVNTSVYCWAGEQHKEISGRILNNDWSGWINDADEGMMYYRHYYETSIDIIGGDSGSPVYVKVSDSYVGIIGIVSAGGTSSIICKYEYITDVLGVDIYN